MPRKTSKGYSVLTASEIASYVVCPESWRLSSLQRKKPSLSHRAQLGNSLHEDWNKKIDSATELTRRLRTVLLLLAMALLLFMLRLDALHHDRSSLPTHSEVGGIS